VSFWGAVVHDTAGQCAFNCGGSAQLERLACLHTLLPSSLKNEIPTSAPFLAGET
jgi:hypothetical protein